MFQGRYQIRNFWTFLAKRIIRVEPPYLASVVLAVFLMVVSGYSSQISPIAVLLHIGYLIPFFQPKYTWLTGVYWSLAVEFTYYLTIALIFPLITSRVRATRIAACLAFAAICFWPVKHHHTLLESAPVFVMGISAMLYKVGISSKRELIGMGLVTTALSIWSMWLSAALLALATMLILLFVRRTPSWLLLIGDISYSLYLLHALIGSRVMHQASRFIPAQYPMVLMIIGMAVSLAAALLMYQLLERPAKVWASRIRYSPSQGSALNSAKVAAGSRVGN